MNTAYEKPTICALSSGLQTKLFEAIWSCCQIFSTQAEVKFCSKFTAEFRATMIDENSCHFLGQLGDSTENLAESWNAIISHFTFVGKFLAIFCGVIILTN